MKNIDEKIEKYLNEEYDEFTDSMMQRRLEKWHGNNYNGDL